MYKTILPARMTAEKREKKGENPVDPENQLRKLRIKSFLDGSGAITTGCIRRFVPRTNKNELTFLDRSQICVLMHEYNKKKVFYFFALQTSLCGGASLLCHSEA